LLGQGSCCIGLEMALVPLGNSRDLQMSYKKV
jgi:hypothetical protein